MKTLLTLTAIVMLAYNTMAQKLDNAINNTVPESLKANTPTTLTLNTADFDTNYYVKMLTRHIEKTIRFRKITLLEPIVNIDGRKTKTILEGIAWIDVMKINIGLESHLDENDKTIKSYYFTLGDDMQDTLKLSKYDNIELQTSFYDTAIIKNITSLSTTLFFEYNGIRYAYNPEEHIIDTVSQNTTDLLTGFVKLASSLNTKEKYDSYTTKIDIYHNKKRAHIPVAIEPIYSHNTLNASKITALITYEEKGQTKSLATDTGIKTVTMKIEKNSVTPYVISASLIPWWSFLVPNAYIMSDKQIKKDAPQENN